MLKPSNLCDDYYKKTLLIPPYSFLIPLEPLSNLAGAKSSIGSSQLPIWLETPFLGGSRRALFDSMTNSLQSPQLLLQIMEGTDGEAVYFV